MVNTTSSRLLILACSATKRAGPAYMPAIQRYDGPLWRTLRAVDPNGEKAKVASLSAHLGFRAADTPIELYEARMTRQMATAMMAGDLGTRWPRPETLRRVMPSGQHPGMHIASLCGGGQRRPFDAVALAGGQLYLDPAVRQAGRKGQMTIPSFPTVYFCQISRDDLNACLVAWGHRMGPIHRPTGAWSHGLVYDVGLVAVVATDTLIRERVAGLTQRDAVELSRLCAARPDLCRVALRLWRAFVFPALCRDGGFLWAVSYQDAAIHSGNLYRFDGWVRLAASRSGTDSRSGRKGRRKIIWGWRNDQKVPAVTPDDTSPTWLITGATFDRQDCDLVVSRRGLPHR